jgi:hypothetical protein
MATVLHTVEPCTGSEDSRRSKLLGFSDNQHKKMVKSLALCTGRHYPQVRSLVIIAVRVRVNPRAIVRPERLIQ